MKNNLINILANSTKELDNQLLMDYVSGKLSDSDQHAVEEWLADNQFAADALDGLQEFGNKDQLQEYVRQLNLDLKSFLLQKKQRREKRKWKDHPWTYIAIVFILCLVIITYLLLRLLSENSR
ncbi:hypothetical protein [Flavihumibacter fluvii]|uniref:hypothetical protein n=1 Tax=Flavihumibacter fluvii TaxID=2838157 RepID=UPI001BDEB542|nr:hypothetical protein [Flavihumibacter fluvii]ULQ53723.1 hypothetical protein KJS93_05225 [Flavihumibacter fluvii]